MRKEKTSIALVSHFCELDAFGVFSFFVKKGGTVMYRMNEEQSNVITSSWLQNTVDEKLVEMNRVWPYLTLRGFIKEDITTDEAATIQEIIDFMKDKGYDFVCVSNVDVEGCKDIVFKYQNFQKS